MTFHTVLRHHYQHYCSQNCTRCADDSDYTVGNWTTRGYANSRTGQVADWTTRGLADAAKRTKTRKKKKKKEQEEEEEEEERNRMKI